MSSFPKKKTSILGFIFKEKSVFFDQFLPGIRPFPCPQSRKLKLLKKKSWEGSDPSRLPIYPWYHRWYGVPILLTDHYSATDVPGFLSIPWDFAEDTCLEFILPGLPLTSPTLAFG